jgi:large subunit ribosomal protein L41
MNALRYFRSSSRIIPRTTFLLEQSNRVWAMLQCDTISLNHQYQLQTTRQMSKYLSKSRKKNLPLTTKRAHKGFYKGKGCTTEGRLTSTGRFIVNPLKQLKLVVPDLSGFKLKPYIASSASRFPPEERHNPVSA